MTTDAEIDREIVADLHRGSEFYRSYTDRGIDPHAPAGPDADDLADMGYVNCGDCGLLIEEAMSNLACSDGARGCCGDCHDAICGDRSCRESD